jgi:hypothetical protein
VHGDAIAESAFNSWPVQDGIEHRAIQRAEAVAHIEATRADLIQKAELTGAVPHRFRVQRNSDTATHLDTVAGEGPVQT